MLETASSAPSLTFAPIVQLAILSVPLEGHAFYAM
jgi:hypothetical protein